MPSDISEIAKLLNNATTPLGRVRAGGTGLEVACLVGWAQGGRPSPRDFPLVDSDFYGSSRNFVYELRAHYPGLIVPEGEILPLMGAQLGWSPEREQAVDAGPCPTCREACRPPDDDEEPSLFTCLQCGGSAFDHRLEQQCQIAGMPPRRDRPATPRSSGGSRPPAAEPMTRKARRAAQFGPLHARLHPDVPAIEPTEAGASSATVSDPEDKSAPSQESAA